ncbi:MULTISPECIES: thioredoxin fold domain-containing protein [Flavobacteriaceae]|uniref:thioredoxin fold domain-containing protein n=1 Tax=Flavobacteriaceae TaxID=49546 RepID=UPI001490D43A|nr:MULTISPECIES: thioredoxin fold domain-containing protein [Allomuricauda]MDC6364906.1 hypothetical protein [Muricauda sp. AC10]
MKISRYFRLALIFSILLSFSFSIKSTTVPSYRLVLFEGSDWCVNCIRFDKHILRDEKFVEFLDKEDIEIQRVDFPQRKKLNADEESFNASMAEKYGFQGIFPTILLVESDTNEIFTLEYHDQEALEFIEQIKGNILE